MEQVLSRQQGMDSNQMLAEGEEQVEVQTEGTLDQVDLDNQAKTLGP